MFGYDDSQREGIICDPLTLTVAATTVAAAGNIVGGINSNNQAKYQSRVYQANAVLDRKAAQDALERGATEERRQYQRTAQLLGQQRAALASNGVEVDFGSAAAIQADTKQIGMEDAQTIRENATREARGFEISAFNADTKAVASKAAGKGALIGGFFDAGSTILSGASQVGRMKAARSGAA